MKLYVMRHGPAVDHALSGRDDDRALTPPGRERVRVVAAALVEGGEAPLHIVSSPLVRSLQTAEIVAAVTRVADREGTVDVRRELAPGGPLKRLVGELAASGLRRLMVVGHEPDLSGLVGDLLGHPMPTSMAKAMVVGLRLRDDGHAQAKLRFILDPKSGVWEHDTRSDA